MAKIMERELVSRLIFFYPYLPLLLFTWSHPYWFTTSIETIDPWIYWGAGDNPDLSFSNQFGETYYLQRYVVIVPQLIFQIIFGPFYSQLIIALFWLTLIFLAIRILVKNPLSYVLITTVLTLDPTFIGMIGVSYTQAASIALMLSSLAIAVRLFEILEDSRRSSSSYKSLAIILGSLLALLSNSYLLIFLFFAPALVFSILATIFRGGMAKSKIYLIFWITFGGMAGLVFLQLVYWLITRSQIPYLFSQLKLGSDLTRSANLWGGDAGVLQLFEKISNPIFSHWWMGFLILFLVLLFKYLFEKDLKLTNVQFFLVVSSFCSSGIFFLMHATYINPIGYAWSALVLLLPQVVGLHLYVTLFVNSSTSKKTWLTGTLFSIFILTLLSENLIRFFGVDLIKLDWFLIGIIIVSALSFFSLFLLSDTVKLRIINFLIVILILCTISLRSIFLSYAGDLTGAGDDSRKIYETLSVQRNSIQDLKVALNNEYRIWFTPENSKPLLSSQLYAYSLISTIPGEAQCNQVSWAASSPAIIVSFDPNESLTSISKIYLEKCGFMLAEIPSDQVQADVSRNFNFVKGIIQRLSD